MEFTNDEVGIVTEVNQDEKLRPQVVLLLGNDKKPRKEKLIDLSKRQRDFEGEVYTIRRTLSANDYDINIMDFYNSNVLQNNYASL